tara:strand:+ start:1063 stop:1653 length:591 start_codon:yes stop_codon:yes gene_type:complete
MRETRTEREWTRARLELLCASLKPALVDARQKPLQRAHVNVALKLIASDPHAQPVDLVLRGVLVDLLLAVVLQCALEGQRLDAPASRGVEVLDVHIERLEERVVNERALLLLLLLLLLFVLFVLLFSLLPLPSVLLSRWRWQWRIARQERGKVGVLASALCPTSGDDYVAARTVGRVWVVHEPGGRNENALTQQIL